MIQTSILLGAQVHFSKFVDVSKAQKDVSIHTRRIRCEEGRVCAIYTTLVPMNGIKKFCFVKVEGKAVYFDSNHNYTVYERGTKTVSVRRSSRANKRCAVCVTVVTSGRKLPLFVVFTGTVNGCIAKELQSIMPDGMIGCTQEKA